MAWRRGERTSIYGSTTDQPSPANNRKQYACSVMQYFILIQTKLIAMLVHVDACIWMSWFMREHVHIETLVNWFLRACHAEEQWRIDAYGDRRGHASAIVEKDKWKRKTQTPEENVRGREDWPYLYVNRPWRERLEVAARSFITWWVFSCSSAAILVLLSTCTECTKLRIYESSMAMHLSQNGYGKAQVHAIFI